MGVRPRLWTEPRSGSSTSNTQADACFYELIPGKRFLLDVRVSLTAYSRRESLAAQATDKTDTYGGKCKKAKWEFVPFVVSTFGELEEQAASFCVKLIQAGDRIHGRDPSWDREAFATSLYRGISLAVHAGCTRQIHKQIRKLQSTR